jgi:bifunctional pyridoxal-dependent enzyme with beta-cystathionase and maltose regulon repressor activities
MITKFETFGSKCYFKYFVNDELIKVNEDEMFELIEVGIPENSFTFRPSDGSYLLWIDWMDNEQLETLATTLMKDIKQPFLA